MPTKSPIELSEGALYLNGCEVKGIPDFVCTDEVYDKSFEKSTSIIYGAPDEFTLTATCKLDYWSFLKLIGMWDWVMTYRPNKRVVHLAKYGRTTRVRHKNFRRACRLLEKEILR